MGGCTPTAPRPEAPASSVVRLASALVLAPWLRRHDLQHELGRLAVLALLDGRLVDDHGACDIDDDAGLAGRRLAAAERLDEADGRLARLGRQLQHDVGQLDEDAVGVGEREDLELDGALEPDDEPGARAVAFEGRLGTRAAAGFAAGPAASCCAEALSGNTAPPRRCQ